jgi:hypothetical protein
MSIYACVVALWFMAVALSLVGDRRKLAMCAHRTVPAFGLLTRLCSAFLFANDAFRTASLRTKVSVSGKQNFARRDEGAETAPKVKRRHCRDQGPREQPRQFGASRRDPGKFCERWNAWWG